MSDPRSAYPKATAWTFLLDTPADAGGAPATKAPPPSAASGNGSRPRQQAAAGAKAAAKRKPSLASSSSSRSGGGGSSSCSGTEEMGASCSKPHQDSVADKENMAELEEMLVPNGRETTSNGLRRGRNGLGAADSEDRGEAPKEAPVDEGEVLRGAALDSTAFLSPEPDQTAPAEAGSALVAAVDNGIAAGLQRGGHAGSAGDGRMRFEDKTAWIARSLEMLPRGAAAVEVDQLKQVRDREKSRAVGGTHGSRVFISLEFCEREMHRKTGALLRRESVLLSLAFAGRHIGPWGATQRLLINQSSRGASPHASVPSVCSLCCLEQSRNIAPLHLKRANG